MFCAFCILNKDWYFSSVCECSGLQNLTDIQKSHNLFYLGGHWHHAYDTISMAFPRFCMTKPG